MRSDHWVAGAADETTLRAIAKDVVPFQVDPSWKIEEFIALYGKDQTTWYKMQTGKDSKIVESALLHAQFLPAGKEDLIREVSSFMVSPPEVKAWISQSGVQAWDVFYDQRHGDTVAIDHESGVVLGCHAEL